MRAATGRADSRVLRAGLRSSEPGARIPHPELHQLGPRPDPAGPAPAPAPSGRWTTPTSIRTTRAWRPWRRPPTATSAPAASLAASNTVPCGLPSPPQGHLAPRSAPPTVRLAPYATTSPRPTRQVSAVPSQPYPQIPQNLHSLPYSASGCDCTPTNRLQSMSLARSFQCTLRTPVIEEFLGRDEPHPLVPPVPLSPSQIPTLCLSDQRNRSSPGTLARPSASHLQKRPPNISILRIRGMDFQLSPVNSHPCHLYPR